MEKSLTLLCFFLTFGDCIVYIDRVTTDFNPKLVDFKIKYTHNSKGEAVTNVTYVTCVNITKILAYVKLRIPENKDDREYRKGLVSTVVDVGKLFKGLQSNILVKIAADSILRCIDFELKFPLGPGTYRMVNLIIDSTYLPFPQDFIGVLEIRVVVKTSEHPKVEFFAQASVYGGFKIKPQSVFK